MAKDYGEGEPGARGERITISVSLPEEAFDFFGEMALKFNRENQASLTTPQFIEDFLLAISISDHRRDPAVTHRLRKKHGK